MKISVLIGIYNCAATLPEALDSMLNQTYQDFEMILCDDGSKDNTYEVAESYASKYPNIILIRNDVNKGLNYTLNNCFKYAKGEYIARMDGDDISLPTRFEKEVAVLENNPEISIVCSSIIRFDERGDYKIGKSAARPQSKDFVRGNPFAHGSCMVRREAFESVEGYSEAPKLIRVEDYHLWFKMYAKGFRGFNISEPLYKLRDGRDAFSRRKFSARLNEAYVRYIGFKMLNLPLYNYVYVLKPIVVWMLPFWLYKLLRNFNK